MKKLKVLCVCTRDANRSKYLATYLKKRGYETRYGGTGPCKFDPHPANPAKEEDVDWADVIITARKKHQPILKNKFNVKKKRVIVLDVSDSKRRAEEKNPEIKKMSYGEFQRKYTYRRLRYAINKYLPLKK